MTVLEFATGWSTLVMANAVKYNINKYFKNIKNLRLNNAGQIHTIDNEKKWNNVTKAKTKKYSKHVKIQQLCIISPNGQQIAQIRRPSAQLARLSSLIFDNLTSDLTVSQPQRSLKTPRRRHKTAPGRPKTAPRTPRGA